MTAPQRIQLRRTKGWRKPAGAVVVSRPSRWGNPFPIGHESPFSRDDAVRMYREMIVSRVAVFDGHRFTAQASTPTVEQIRGALAGHDLACWCPLDQPCHADVLLDLANT